MGVKKNGATRQELRRLLSTRFAQAQISLGCLPDSRTGGAPLSWHNPTAGATMSSLSELAKNRPVEAIVEREIQIRAYELYEERGKGQGLALKDWLEAEAEVLARCSRAS